MEPNLQVRVEGPPDSRSRRILAWSPLRPCIAIVFPKGKAVVDRRRRTSSAIC